MRRSFAPSRTAPGSPLLQSVLQKQTVPLPNCGEPSSPSCPSPLCHVAASPKSDSNRYYAVLWAKASTKKHKTWEGDATMMVCGRDVTVTDEKGATLAQSCATPLTKLAVIQSGDRLMIGGKEIEIQEELDHRPSPSAPSMPFNQSRNMVKKEKSNSASGSPHHSPTWTKASLDSRKPFVIPLKDPKLISANFYVGPKGSRPCQEPATPADPDAIVMPRPTRELVNLHDRSENDVTDVIIDPVVARHLRSHQVEGVIFLYECMMGLRKPPCLAMHRSRRPAALEQFEEDADLFEDDKLNDQAIEFKYSSRNRYGAILADDMGLGKSLQTIATIWTLFKQGPFNLKPVIQRVLLVCPSSLMKQWVTEFHKWLGASRLRVIAVSKSSDLHEFLKLRGSAVEASVLVISYELAAKSVDRFESVGFDLLVCDEAHRLRNATIKANLVLSGLGIPRVILLSGTPVQNNLMELHTLCDFIYPGIFGTASAFKRVYEDPITKGHKLDSTVSEKAEGLERTKDLLSLTTHFLLRRTQEVNQQYLTAKTEFVLFCQPSQLQTSIYEKVLARNFTLTEDGAFQTGSRHLMVIDVLKKLCSHPVMLFQTKSESLNSAEANEINDEPTSRIFDNSMFPEDFSADGVSVIDSGKLATTCAILQNLSGISDREREKVVVVSNYVQTLNLLESLCDASGFSYYRLDGSTPTDDRLAKVTKFNSPSDKTFVFLLSSKAGGVGLNLVGASRLILFDIDWNPANDLQSMARIWRDGQTKPVYIYRLLTTGTIEEKIFQRQIKKQGLTGAVVKKSDRNKDSANNDLANAASSSVTSFTNAELRDLFTLHPNTQCQTHDVLRCCCRGSGVLVNRDASPVASPGLYGGGTGLESNENGPDNALEKVENNPGEARSPSRKKRKSNNDNRDLDVSMAQLRQWAHYSANHIDIDDCFANSALNNCSIFLTWVLMLKNCPSTTNAVGISQDCDSDAIALGKIDF